MLSTEVIAGSAVINSSVALAKFLGIRSHKSLGKTGRHTEDTVQRVLLQQYLSTTPTESPFGLWEIVDYNWLDRPSVDISVEGSLAFLSRSDSTLHLTGVMFLRFRQTKYKQRIVNGAHFKRGEMHGWYDVGFLYDLEKLTRGYSTCLQKWPKFRAARGIFTDIDLSNSLLSTNFKNIED
ncbi:MAG: hypothetical protein AAF937_08560, partial [Planctomycetota bacterium]